MNETAGIALLYLMFGQFLILSFGILILWWMSEPGSRWTQSRAERRAKAKEAELTEPEPAVPVGAAVNLQAAVKPQAGKSNALLALANDCSIEPNLVKEDNRAAPPSRDHAVQA